MGLKETRLSRITTNALMKAIRAYQKLRPESVGRQCRFVPSCSCYAHTALEKDGLKALPKIIWRLMRCNPINGKYYKQDPYTNSKKAS